MLALSLLRHRVRGGGESEHLRKRGRLSTIPLVPFSPCTQGKREGGLPLSPFRNGDRGILYLTPQDLIQERTFSSRKEPFSPVWGGPPVSGGPGEGPSSLEKKGRKGPLLARWPGGSLRNGEVRPRGPRYMPQKRSPGKEKRLVVVIPSEQAGDSL